MSNNKSKGHLLQKFLDFVGAHITLTDAKIVTLGGRGLEASIWKANGIPQKNGWLIERNVKLSKALIRSSIYRLHNDLETFPGVMDGVYGGNVGLDALHLDLCGTLESRAHVINPLLNLLRKGRARCLAITVTEQRRNETLENWYPVEVTLKKHFPGDLYEKVYHVLHAEQLRAPRISNDPEGINRSVQRELGVIRLMYEGLATAKMFPELVQRYGYISSSNTRMRTYIMHLVSLPLPGSLANRPMGLNLFESWTANPVMWVNKQGDQNPIHSVQSVPKNKQEMTDTVMEDIRNKVPKLAALVLHMSDEVKGEFELLISAAEGVPSDYEAVLARNKTLENVCLQIHGLSNEVLNGRTTAPESTPKGSESVDPGVVISPVTGKPKRAYKKRAGTGKAKAAAKGKSKAGKKPSAKKVKELEQAIAKIPVSEVKEGLITDGFSPEVAELIGLMEIEAEHPDLIDAARFVGAKNLGMDPRKETERRQFGGKVARTRGKHFEGFIKRTGSGLEHTQQINFATAVAPVASKLFGREISANELMDMM